MRRTSLVALCVGCLCGVVACEGGGQKSTGGSGPAAKVNPTALQAQAMLPPPSNAKPATSIGSGPVQVNTANAQGDTDSMWVAQIDIDGDGDIEQTDLLWDDEDKILYAYAQTDVACAFGGTATVAILAGVNGVNNPRGRAPGSGFYAVYFDGMECGADRAGVYGCTFNPAGQVTAWGAAVVDSLGDEIDMVGTN